jgi:SAM-dependent methyltransferase
MDKTKENWEYYGENDPYYAVATLDKFRRENLTESNKDDFFQTGYEHIQKLWDEIEDNFIEVFEPQKCLDFGCGVGRLVIPLAEKCEKVVGVDISELMLEEAARNCKNRKTENIKFLQTDEFLSGAVDKFDFIHSFIVFQHINPVEGEKIVKKIIDSLAVDGIGVLHFAYANPSNDRNFWKFKIYRDYPFINQLKNFVKGGTNEPLLPIYIYDLNKIFSLLQENDCHKCLVRFSFHGTNGVLIIFQKKKELKY